MKYLILISALLVSLTGFAQEPSVQGTTEILAFESDEQRRLFAQLTAELRCPQCQNQNIADSNAVVSIDMRDKTYELIMQGYNRQQVLDFMIDRYGNFVHYKPPVNHITIWLWLLPLLILAALLVFQLRRRQMQQQVDDTAATAGDGSAKARLNAELDQIIERYRSKKS